ncbi:acyltransferase [Vibrio cyclitrophicus]|uniref:acyltransferase n=1 Tax=Vibrio cyclitrophicus TaxID=47951 RepID=UPI000C858D1A|nr:acyltransferase [Vibrio cyclitrophicus]PMG36264.1 hypothetical protein BCU92_20780 [Vibrio cyclitrophicus]
MNHKLTLLWSWFVWLITYFLPDAPLIMRLRGLLYSPFMAKCGHNFQVASTCRILGLETLYVGDNVYFAANSFINGGGEIHLGNDVMLGIGVVVVSGNHTLLDGSYRFGRREEKSIDIGFGSWVGANSTILAGAVVPESSIVAAGGVVTCQLTSSGVYGGVPVRKIK